MGFSPDGLENATSVDSGRRHKNRPREAHGLREGRAGPGQAAARLLRAWAKS